jgi:hypothetical protein
MPSAEKDKTGRGICEEEPGPQCRKYLIFMFTRHGDKELGMMVPVEPSLHS